jgi:hypothetical protein
MKLGAPPDDRDEKRPIKGNPPGQRKVRRGRRRRPTPPGTEIDVLALLLDADACRITDDIPPKR